MDQYLYTLCPSCWCCWTCLLVLSSRGRLSDVTSLQGSKKPLCPNWPESRHRVYGIQSNIVSVTPEPWTFDFRDYKVKRRGRGRKRKKKGRERKQDGHFHLVTVSALFESFNCRHDVRPSRHSVMLTVEQLLTLVEASQHAVSTRRINIQRLNERPAAHGPQKRHEPHDGGDGDVAPIPCLWYTYKLSSPRAAHILT